jgi:hypothetical protein
VVNSDCPTNASGEISSGSPLVHSYPVPKNGGIPKQEPGKPRRPSGLGGKALGGFRVRDERLRRRKRRKRRRGPRARGRSRYGR